MGHAATLERPGSTRDQLLKVPFFALLDDVFRPQPIIGDSYVSIELRRKLFDLFFLYMLSLISRSHFSLISRARPSRALCDSRLGQGHTVANWPYCVCMTVCAALPLWSRLLYLCSTELGRLVCPCVYRKASYRPSGLPQCRCGPERRCALTAPSCPRRRTRPRRRRATPSPSAWRRAPRPAYPG